MYLLKIINDKKLLNICLVTNPREKAGVSPLSNFISILYPLSNVLHVITGNEGIIACKKYSGVHCHSILFKQKTHILTRISNHICLQLKISYEVLKLTNKNIDMWIFFMTEGTLLPVLLLKLLRKKVIYCLASSSKKIVEINKNSSGLDRILEIFENVNYKLSNVIILYSNILIKKWCLEKYKHKILIAPRHFINFNKFNIKKPLYERTHCTVGYIGRLSEEKGILNFLKVIPPFLKRKNNVNFFILVSVFNLGLHLKHFILFQLFCCSQL